MLTVLPPPPPTAESAAGQNATAAPPAEAGGTSGSFDVTPLVVTLILLLVLVPVVVYGFHYIRKKRNAKNKSLKAGNVSGTGYIMENRRNPVYRVRSLCFTAVFAGVHIR